MSGRRLKRRLLNRYCIIGRSKSVTPRAKKRTWSGLIMTRNYKRLGGIINASAGPAKARAVFAESFGILRKNVVNLRKNPVSSRVSRSLFCHAPTEMWKGEETGFFRKFTTFFRKMPKLSAKTARAFAGPAEAFIIPPRRL